MWFTASDRISVAKDLERALGQLDHPTRGGERDQARNAPILERISA